MKNRVRWLQLIVTAILLGFLTACSGSPTGTSPTNLSMKSVYQDLTRQRQSVKAAVTTATESQQMTVIKLFQAMFNASPGADLLTLCSGWLAGGMSESDLANLIAGTELFTNDLFYPTKLSSFNFSYKFLNNLVGSTVSEANKSALSLQMAALLDGGWKRGDLIWLLVSALSNISSTEPTWGNAAVQFNNRLNVSYYYSVTKGIPSTDLVTLQAVTASVTNDPATVTAAKTRIDAQAPMAVSISIGSDLADTTISPLFGVNAGPTPQGDATNPDVTKQYQAIGVNMVRTHDLYGPLDMSVMYPDRSKSPALASSYDFTSSDLAFDAIIQGGFEPYFRVGDSYNNVKPPVNATERANWAAAAVYIVGRYLGRGGFKHVEVGNEPDYSQFWPAPRTMQEFYDLYVRTAKAIKTAYPSLKVGGPGFTHNCFKTSEGKTQLSAFLSYVKAQGAPLDFFSWHQYSNDPGDYKTGAVYIRQQLDANGFTATENHITEWNSDDRNDNPADVRLGGKGAAIITGSWITLMQNGMHQSLFFRGNDTSMALPTFYGLLYADGTYKRNAHAFSLWSKVSAYPYRLNSSVTSGALDVSKIHLLAGRNSSGNKALLLANLHTNTLSVTLNGMKSPIRTRIVSDASTGIQESSQTGLVVTIPGYSAALITEDGL